MKDSRTLNKTVMQAEFLNSLATNIRRKTYVKCQGGYFYLTLWQQDHHERIACFVDPEDFARALIRLSLATPISAEQFLKGKGELWDKESKLSTRRKELVSHAQTLDRMEKALEQQEVMEQAWALRKQEILCATRRVWLDAYGLLPEHIGIDIERHDPELENPADPVPIVDFDWLSGEFRCHSIKYFAAVYDLAGQWPCQNYVAELRRFHTNNVKLAWDRVVETKILPTMDRIRDERAYSAPWRELVQQAKVLIAPWSLARPWPAKKKERKKQRERVKEFPSARRCDNQAATA
jgi:hypothetical protein